MWFFDWFRKDNSMNVLHRGPFELHKTAIDMILALTSRIEKLEEASEETQGDVRSLEKQVKGHEETAKVWKPLRNRIKKTRQWLKHIHDRVSALEGAGTEQLCYQSGKSHLASDEVEDPGKYTETFTTHSPVADGIKFEGEKGINYVVGLIEERDKYKKLLESQHRMINRLYKLAVASVEDPGKSITEDLRKAEKWKKTLHKKFKELKED